MLPFAGPCGLCFRPLFAGDFLAQSNETRVVCISFFFLFLTGSVVALVFDVGFGVAASAAMSVRRGGAWGGEGARPIEGATRNVSGKERFSLGFLNIEEGRLRSRVGSCGGHISMPVANNFVHVALSGTRSHVNL